MSDKKKKEDKKSFWETLPGKLIGLPVLITAFDGSKTILVPSSETMTLFYPPQQRRRIALISRHLLMFASKS